MCPLISAPNRGYADYQRTGNWDTGVLFTYDVTNVTSSENSPLIDVSRFAYLAGFLACNAGICSVDLRWWSDTALSALLGVRHFRMTGANGAIAQMRVPNLGPFITIQVNPIGGNPYTANGWFTATNRVNPIELVPQNPVLIDQQAIPIGANGVVNPYPSDYYSGPIFVWYDSQYATGALQLQALNANGVWEPVWQLAHTTSGNFTQVLVAPSGAWRMLVNNTTAAASTFYLAVIPSTSGAT